MITPRKEDLVIYQGATFHRSFRVGWTSSDGETFTPLDSDGWSARMQIRDEVDAPDYWIELTTEDGGLVFEEITEEGEHADTRLHVLMAPAQSDLFTSRKGVYDIELISPEENVYRGAEGSVRVSPQVTR